MEPRLRLRRLFALLVGVFVLVITAAAVGVEARASDPVRVCLTELRRALPAPEASNAVAAVELLARMVTLAEPAFPALRGGQGPIEAGELGAAAARFLHRRYLLPDGWSPSTHDDDAWRRMLGDFAGRYRASAPTMVGANHSGMVGDAARTLAVVSDSLRPLAVFATDPNDEVSFFAVIWNWTPAPRLLIVRPHEGLALVPGGNSEARARSVLEEMSTCAIRFESFVYAGEDVALRIFVQQGESMMRVLASDPPRDTWPLVIPAERVVEAFRFDDAALDGLDMISVSIEGPSIGVGTAVSVLGAVRTNLGLDGILRHLAFP